MPRALNGAEAVVIGGGPLSEAAARLRHRPQATIVEPVPAAMRLVLLAPGGARPEGRKQFFFEKKNQKTLFLEDGT